ncbi:electron transfer flavoprotein subunit alpha/FixB family protein [Adlercreutzia sp. ZJ473]|uniref:electron transfer flavoprotein subunit alpha/FixB family protein n=1 Tax=Adlercreutzia sp. ZJ473 TaxID=2722822 RepID=UPI0015527697|nr:FAD-binding protein [Adlercreutzia sp. ZJ473]
MNKDTIILIAEEPRDFEVLIAGAVALGGKPVAIYAGPDADAQKIAAMGARVLHFGELTEGALFADAADAFENAITSEGGSVILGRSTKAVQEIAGKLAVRLNAGVVNDATSLAWDDDALLLTHLVYGGSAVRIEKATGSVIALLGPSAFEPVTLPAGEVVACNDAIEVGPFRLLDVIEKEEEQVDLGAAKIVVCVGRGIGTQENLAAIEAFARKLGAEMTCTRPITEVNEWMARSRYLGVSGTTIKPDVYIGFGISGQVQHTVGMNGAKTVVVVNKDKNAPFFKQCDLGLVADVDKVLPYL